MTSPSMVSIFKLDTSKYFLTDFSKLDSYFDTYTYLPDIVNPNVFVGIEIEMENSSPLNHGEYERLWSFRGDGSLRNNGLEAVSLPVKGKWITNALHSLYKVIPGVVFSHRTSIHVHLDVREFTQKQLTAFLLVYLSVESLLYRFVGKDRHENIYCVPLYLTTLVDALVDFLNKDFVKYNFGASRYAGLNLDAIRKFGTLEFRQLHGTHDVRKIVNWINFLIKIYDYSLSHKLEDIITKISELNTNSLYINYLNEVFGNVVTLLDLTDIKNDLEKGVKAVKQSIVSNKFLLELKKALEPTSPALIRYYALSGKSPRTRLYI